MAKKPKLIFSFKDKKNFIAECTYKENARSFPSLLIANVVYFPETEEETQTFAVELEIKICKGAETLSDNVIQDEFDTAREAKKWITEKYKEFLKTVFAKN